MSGGMILLPLDHGTPRVKGRNGLPLTLGRPTFRGRRSDHLGSGIAPLEVQVPMGLLSAFHVRRVILPSLECERPTGFWKRKGDWGFSRLF